MSRAAALVLVAALVVVAGCGKLREKIVGRLQEKVVEAQEKAVEAQAKAVEAQGGGRVEIAKAPGGGESVVVEGDGGRVEAQTGPEVRVPDDFPAKVPLYPDAKVRAVMAADRDGKRAHVLAFDTPDDAELVARFYRDKLGAGWKQSVDLTAGPARTIQLVGAGDKLEVLLVLTRVKDHTSVQLTVTPSR